jgi:hypothetical protein
MAHYAFLDENNLVIEVIVGKDENSEGVDWEKHYEDVKGKTCKRTSYNTFGNQHLDGGTAFRGNYAGLGYTYDETNDVFIGQQPFESWILDKTSWLWNAPKDYPSDGKGYTWNEEKKKWDLRSE